MYLLRDLRLLDGTGHATSNGPHIVGTHSGDESEYRFPFGSERVNVDAGGDALNNLVTWARSNW